MEENLKIPNHVAIILTATAVGPKQRNAPQLRAYAGSQDGGSDL